jgi:hypothetical protein
MNRPEDRGRQFAQIAFGSTSRGVADNPARRPRAMNSRRSFGAAARRNVVRLQVEQRNGSPIGAASPIRRVAALPWRAIRRTPHGASVLGIHEIQPDTAGVFLTGFTTVDVVYPAIEAGVLRVLPKPVDFQELIPIIEDHVGSTA